MKPRAFAHASIPSHIPPETPSIDKMGRLVRLMMDEGVPLDLRYIILMNQGINLKAHWIKQSFQRLNECKNNFCERIDADHIKLKPEAIIPISKELDMILFQLSSILDFFSREIDILFKLGYGKHSSFNKIVNSCKKKNINDPLVIKLIELTKCDWYKYFRKMRNRITHRMPFNIQGRRGEIYLPLNPNDDEIISPTVEKYEIIETSKTWIYEILEVVDISTDEIGRRKIKTWDE